MTYLHSVRFNIKFAILQEIATQALPYELLKPVEKTTEVIKYDG